MAGLWLGSVGAAYWLGGATSGRNWGTVQEPVQTLESAETEAVRAAEGRLLAVTDAAQCRDPRVDGKGEVGAVLARVLRAMPPGAPGLQDIPYTRDFVRALAPLAELRNAEMPEAITAVKSAVSDYRLRYTLVQLLYGQWEETDAQGAFKFSFERARKEISGLEWSDPDVAWRLGAWARAEPETAWRWFEDVAGRSFQPLVCTMVPGELFRGMAARDVDFAVARLNRLGQITTLQAIPGLAMAASTDAARERLLLQAEAQPAALRRQIQSSVLGTWSGVDAERALKYVETLPPEERPAMLASAARGMFATHPEQGAELLLENAKPEDRGRLIGEVVERWTNYDSPAAGAWLARQAGGAELDDARAAYIERTMKSDPVAAMAWAGKIHNEDRRREMTEKIVRAGSKG